MNYNEMLKEAENFMEKTGIRMFCTEYCKGECCGGCYTSENSCKGEERRLPCSAYLCDSLRNLLRPELDEYYRVRDRIENGIKDAGHQGSVYYERISQEVKDKRVFRKEEIFSNNEKILSIRCKVGSLMELFNKIRRLEREKPYRVK